MRRYLVAYTYNVNDGCEYGLTKFGGVETVEILEYTAQQAKKSVERLLMEQYDVPCKVIAVSRMDEILV